MRSIEGKPERRTPESFIKFKDKLAGIGWSVNHQLAARRVSKDIESSKPLERLFDTHFDLLNNHSEEQLKTVLYTTAIASGVREKNAHRKIRRALKIADYAHQEQNRKFSSDSYKVHPMRAAILAMEIARAMGLKVTTELIVGAILHDTIEDNHEAIYPGFLREIYIDMEPDYGARIEADAEALSKYITDPTTGEHHKLEGEKYARKIAFNPYADQKVDKETLLRRIIIKTADRMDNLLDPPIFTGSYVDNSLTSSRLKTIIKTVGGKKGDEEKKGDVKPLLEENMPYTKDLINILDKAIAISAQSIMNPTFDPSNWRDYALAA